MARQLGSSEGFGTVRSLSVRATPGRSPFLLHVAQDQQDPARYALYIGQGGLLLPGPEYYVDPKFADLKASYQLYLERMLSLLGWPRPQQQARAIVALESRIAKVSWSHEKLLDVARTYNRVTLHDLQRLAPDFDWGAFLQGARVPSTALMVVDAPDAIQGIAQVLAATPLDVLQAKQAVGTAHFAAGHLNRETYAAYLDFAGKTLAGLQQQPSRDFDAEKSLEGAMPDALGKLYVGAYSSTQVKERAGTMAAALKMALDRRLQSSTLFSKEGKRLAREKLAGMQVKIGWPDTFDDYDGLIVREGDYCGNVDRAAAYAWTKDLERLNRPYDRTAWVLTPFYPQYGYSATTNTVEVPAALLMPPFFNLNADDAVNYGADGSLIGSTMMGAFDRAGIEFDKEGNVRRPLYLMQIKGGHFTPLSTVDL